jgi:hypothetical protein
MFLFTSSLILLLKEKEMHLILSLTPEGEGNAFN